MLVPGGRLVCVVSDVCLSRRKNKGRHTVVSLHASTQEHCREIGYDNLAPIIWHKIANVIFEASGVTIQLLQLRHWGAALEGQDERVEKIVGLFAES